MNLDSLFPVQIPLQMIVQNPITGEATDAVIDLLCPYDTLYLQRKQTIARHVIHQAMHQTKEAPSLDLALTAALINGWRNLSLEGKEVIYDEAQAVALLQQFPWLAEQIVFFYNDPSKFFMNSVKK